MRMKVKLIEYSQLKWALKYFKHYKMCEVKSVIVNQIFYKFNLCEVHLMHSFKCVSNEQGRKVEIREKQNVVNVFSLLRNAKYFFS